MVYRRQKGEEHSEQKSLPGTYFSDILVDPNKPPPQGTCTWVLLKLGKHSAARTTYEMLPCFEKHTGYIYIHMYSGVFYKRSSARVPAIAGTHAPGRSEWVEGVRGWLGDIITAVSCRW